MEEQNTTTQAMPGQNQQKSSKTKGCLIGGLIVFAVILIIGMFASMCDNDNDNDIPQIADNGTTSSQSLYTEKEVVKDSVTWKITTETDEMTDSKNIWAKIRSDNYINQDFPYDGDTYAKITVRYMKKYGYDVLIGIDRGQIVGFSYNGSNYVSVRFDKEEPKKYYFNDAADGSTETVFLKNAKDFMNRCKKAHDIKVEIPLYQEGRPIFTFHVDKPLVWPED